MTAIVWLLGAIAVGLSFVLFGFLVAIAFRLSSVFRATILVGPIEWWPIIVMGLFVVLLPLLTLVVARPAIDSVGFGLTVLAAVLGGITGGALAESESRAAPKVLERLAEVSLKELNPALAGRASSVAGTAIRFVDGCPSFLSDILVSVALVFNSPWASWRFGQGFSSFVRKDPAHRRTYVRLWSLDPSLRYPLEFLKVVLSFGVYGESDVWEAIGYCGPVVDGNRDPDGRARFCPYYAEDAAARGIRGGDRFRCWDHGRTTPGGPA